MIIHAFIKNKEIHVDDLGKYGTKTATVIYLCDSCSSENRTTWYALYRKNRIEKQFCRKCTIKLNDVVNKRKATCIEKYGFDNPMKVDRFVNSIDHEKIVKKQRNSFDDIKKSFEDEGYTLLTSEYKNRTQKLEYICPEGHRRKTIFSSWLVGGRCKVCADKNNTRAYSIDFVREKLNQEGYELLSKQYKNKHIPIKYKCPRGHIGSVAFGNWMNNSTRCSSCSHIISKTEIEIYNLLKPYFLDIIHNSRSIIPPLELDIVIPSKKIAIEYCGLYWHSELRGKDRNYHLNKLVQCHKHGYKLITIFEDEWLHKKDIVINRLKHILNVSDAERVYARKCQIREISVKTKNRFLDEFHIQGKDASKIKLGAFYNNNLVSVMTFRKGNASKCIESKDNEYELSRFCYDYNYIVVGIAAKLLKYFIRNYNPNIVFTYGDKRWSDGNLYKKIGFEYSHDSQPNYWYVVETKRLHRFNFRKSILNKKLDNFDPSISEWKNMKLNGYDRIWDCGNTKWIMKT